MGRELPGRTWLLSAVRFNAGRSVNGLANRERLLCPSLRQEANQERVLDGGVDGRLRCSGLGTSARTSDGLRLGRERADTHLDRLRAGSP